jgi:hypothetical protein
MQQQAPNTVCDKYLTQHIFGIVTDNGKTCYDDLQNFQNENVNTMEIKKKQAPIL